MTTEVSVTVGSDVLRFETGRIARQAHGAVLATMGETMVLSAVCAASKANPLQDFFPLTVDYREKSFAAGNIPGNYFRRESRPSEREILICRQTDRPIRPLFPKGFNNEVQVCQTVYSADNIHDPDVIAINAASAALHISKVPFLGPIGAVRVALIGGELQVNPPIAAMEESLLDIVIAGTKEAICMVEGKANEISEDIMLSALEFGHKHIVEICRCIEDLRARVGVEKMTFTPPKKSAEVEAHVNELAAHRLEEVHRIAEKAVREAAMVQLETEIFEILSERYEGDQFEENAPMIKNQFKELERRTMRQQVIATSRRIDGRALDQVRPITIEVGILPRAHGSCLFTRGETQALVTTTLGTSRDEQRIDELIGDVFKRFFLHYNFPPWSVGEVRRISGPGRREIGHGNLAERAIESILPVDSEESAFPYTVRIVSDITESNGSSSMASVCGGSLSLMDAGVPVKSAVAGIAMGMIKEGDEVRILSDILGAEDHLGDMDFKVCGTRNGIAAFQMDVKVSGLSSDIMRRALEQARVGRIHILDKMDECLSQARQELSPLAPRIYTIKIEVDKIREVIGPGGKVVRDIQTKTGADINIEDDGTIHVASSDNEKARMAIEMIQSITAEVEMGKVYRGAVTRITSFGAFVSILGRKEGLVRLPDLALERVNRVEDVAGIGDEIDVKVIEIDHMGRINLSKVEADFELGRIPEEEIAEHRSHQRESRQGREGGRDRERGGFDRGGGRDRGGRDRGGRDRGDSRRR